MVIVLLCNTLELPCLLKISDHCKTQLVSSIVIFLAIICILIILLQYFSDLLL